MYDALSVLGVDPDTLEWQDLSLCDGDPTNDHYDDYESDPNIARMTDAKCLSCPVMVQCLQSGIQNNEWGCWGGIYLTAGKMDKNRNSHKTKEVWAEIKEKIDGIVL